MLCGSHIKIWNLANHMKKRNKKLQNAKSLVKNWKLRVWCSLFHIFMWFARFQTLKCEPQSIWCKLLVLSWLYKQAHCSCEVSSKCWPFLEHFDQFDNFDHYQIATLLLTVTNSPTLTEFQLIFDHSIYSTNLDLILFEDFFLLFNFFSVILPSLNKQS